MPATASRIAPAESPFECVPKALSLTSMNRATRGGSFTAPVLTQLVSPHRHYKHRVQAKGLITNICTPRRATPLARGSGGITSSELRASPTNKAAVMN
jgi:hypothetical protein